MSFLPNGHVRESRGQALKDFCGVCHGESLTVILAKKNQGKRGTITEQGSTAVDSVST
jgi:hypothetical protein